MTWIIDGIPLSTYAFNVANRAAGWKVPAKRGENLVIPGRNGAQWVPNKPFEVGNITLSMWAVGALADGSMPSHGDLRRQARDNLDKLTALFSQSHKLLNVVQVSSLAFGVQNYVPNPGFESGSTGTPSYSNRVLNPSMRRRASTAQMTNLMPNPNVVSLKGPTDWQTFYTNLVPDPTFKFGRTNPTTVLTSNYWNDSQFLQGVASFGTDPNDWSVPNNVDATYQNNTAADRTANPLGGTKCLRFLFNATPSSANSTLGTKLNMYVPAGYTPLLRFRMRRALNTTTTRNIQVRIRVVNTGTTTAVGTGTWQTFAVPSGATTWTDVAYDSGTLLMTTAATEVVVDIRTNETWANGDGIILMCPTINNKGTDGHSTTGFFANVAGPYFDGSSPWGGTEYRTVASNTNVSRWYYNSDARWTAVAPTAANGAYYASVEQPTTDQSGTTLSFFAFGFQTGGTQVFYQELATPTAGKPYALRFNARGLSGTTTRVELAKQAASDTSPVALGDAVTVSGTATGTTTGTRMNGTVGGYVGGVYVPATGDRLFVKVTAPVTTSGHPVFQFTQLHVTDSPINFTGDSTDTSNSRYTWVGTPFNSRSNGLRRVVARIANPTIQVTTLEYTGGDELGAINMAENVAQFDGHATEFLLDPVSFSPVNGAYFSALTSGGVFNDGKVLGSPDPVGRISLRFLDSGGSLLSTVEGDSATLPDATSSSSKRLTVRVQPQSIPSGTAQMQAVLDLVNPRRGQTLRAGRFVLLAQSLSPSELGASDTYFDGSSPNSSWSSTVNNSASSYNVQFPTAWTVINGAPLNDLTALAAKSVVRSTNPSVTLVSPLSSQAAGTYAVGFDTICQMSDSAGAVNNSVTTSVTVQFLQAGVVVASQVMGVLTGSTSQTTLQGAVTANNPFNEVRVVYTSQISGYTISARIYRAFLSLLSTTNPQQRVGFNKVSNPNFFLVGGSLTQWTVAGTNTKIVTPKKNGLLLGANATATSARFTVTSSENLRVAVWGRSGLQCRVRFYNSSNVLVSTNELGVVTQTDYVAPFEALIQAPVNATGADIQFLNSGSGSTAEVAFAYVASNFTMHNDNGEYDPWVFQYVDGDSPSDAFGLPSAWAGEANNSATNVTPLEANGWLPGGPHVVTRPKLVPGGSVGAVGGLSRILRGTSRVVRSAAVDASTASFVSGQISVAGDTGTTVMVEVVSSNAAEGDGAVLFSHVTTQQKEIVTWRDLFVPDNFVFVRVTYTETVNASGYRVWLDNFSLLLTETTLGQDYPGYFDGSSGGAWVGAVNNSASQYYGGGRRAYAEVKTAIDMTSMAGGTRAEFTVDMEIPSSFWEDLITSTITLDVSNPQLISSTTDFNGLVSKGTVFDLSALVETTAPIDDAIITISTFGSVSDLRLTDEATGGWLNISGTIPASVEVDNGAFTVRNLGTKASIISKVTRGGSNQLLPLVPTSSTTPPRLRVSGTGSGSLSIKIVARRRYVIA